MALDDENDDLSVDYVEEEFEGGMPRLMPIVVTLVFVAGFFALAWYAYNSTTETISLENVTLVEADKTPIKEAPADPGGLQVPHQDKTIYETFGENKGSTVAERVLPAPEEPIAINKDNGTETWVNQKLYPKNETTTPVPSSEDAPVAQTTPTVAPTLSTAPITVPIPSANTSPNAQDDEGESLAESIVAQPITPEQKTQPKPDKVDAKKESIPVLKPAKKASEKVEPKAVKAGSYKVQLASFPNEKESQSTWTHLLKKHNSLLSNLQHNIVKADVAGKGTYYRLQAGPFATAADAKKICDALAASKDPCFQIKAK